MKKRNNRFLAGTLAGLMMLTMLPVTALAAQEGADSDAASDTSNNNIVNVVSDGENGQQDGNINIAANGGNENAQESADDRSGDTRMYRNPLTTEAAAVPIQPHLLRRRAKTTGSGSSGEPTPTPTPAAETLLRRLVLRRIKLWKKLSALRRTAIRLKLVRILPLKKGGLALVEKGALTIKGVGDSKPTITMKDLGMSLSKTKVTFENIKIVEEAVTDNPTGNGRTANLVSNSNFTLKKASLELNGPGDKTGGSGMYLYQESNLYVTDGSTVIVSGYSGERASGIFADNSEYDNMPNRNIQVTGNSSITITDCDCTV